MMTINCIVATDRNGAIGNKGQIPWRLSSDLKYFKKTTMGHPILMGRKSYDSIVRPLPGRHNIIITRKPDFDAPGATVCSSIDEGIQQALNQGHDQLFIIGGGEIYKQSMRLWDRLFITHVDTAIAEADTFFPDMNWGQWSQKSRECHPADEKNQYPYCFEVWDRINGTSGR